MSKADRASSATETHCQTEAAAPKRLSSMIDALDELHRAQHLAELLYLAGEGLMRLDEHAGEAITTGVGALKDKLKEVDALIEGLHECEREDAE